MFINLNKKFTTKKFTRSAYQFLLRWVYQLILLWVLNVGIDFFSLSILDLLTSGNSLNADTGSGSAPNGNGDLPPNPGNPPNGDLPPNPGNPPNGNGSFEITNPDVTDSESDGESESYFNFSTQNRAELQNIFQANISSIFESLNDRTLSDSMRTELQARLEQNFYDLDELNSTHSKASNSNGSNGKGPA